MNNLKLRTRTMNLAASSSSRRSSVDDRAPVRVSLRPSRPVFISSPAPKRARFRLRETA